MHFYDKLMETAYDMGLAGKKEDSDIIYQWYFSDSFWVPTKGVNLNVALKNAYNGTGKIIPSAGRLHSETSYEDFVVQLKDIGRSHEDLNYINGMISKHDNIQESYEGEQNNKNESIGIFDNMGDAHIDAAFMYDATIAMGRSACRAFGYENKEGFNGTEQFLFLAEQTRFRGATGKVILNNRTGSRTYDSAFYELFNCITEEKVDEKSGEDGFTFKLFVTDSYHNGSWSPGERSFVYGNGLIEKPPELLPREPIEKKNDKALVLVASLFSILSISLAICFGIWTWCHRSTRVVQASQPFFLYLVSFGVIMVGASILPLFVPLLVDDIKHSQELCNNACIAIVWLFYPGLSIIFSALFTKTYRINLVMRNSKKFRRVTVTIPKTLKTMAIMLTLNIIVLSVMTKLHSPKYKQESKFEDDFNRPIEIYSKCSWEESFPYITTLIVINAVIASLSAYQSWKARGLSTEFAESQYIFAALLMILTLFMVQLPVMTMSGDNPELRKLAYISGVFIFSMSILLLLFVPKMYFHYYRKNDRQTMNSSVEGINLTLSSLNGDEMQGRNNAGERILTTQSATQLAARVTELEELLREKEQERLKLECRCNEMDHRCVDP